MLRLFGPGVRVESPGLEMWGFRTTSREALRCNCGRVTF